MPYIKQDDRKYWDNFIYELITRAAFDSPGELNYVITRIVHKYLDHKGENYQHYNDILGALEGAKLELYRRRVAPYEDVKIFDNGDV